MTATRERPEWADWPRVLVRVPMTSRDRTVPDAPTRVVPCDPDGEPWAIDPEHYRRIHRPALTRRRRRRRISTIELATLLFGAALVAVCVVQAAREVWP